MLSIVIRVYNDVWHLANAVGGIYEIADEIVIIEGAYKELLSKNIPNYTTPRSTDGTLESIDWLLKHDRDSKIKVLYANELDIVEQINMFWSVTSASRGDWVLVVDSDEIYKKEDAIEIKKFLGKITSVSVKLQVFSYNLISDREYRSDSGLMGIGGRVEEPRFYTDRFVSSSGNESVIIPNVQCFHYSLYKPESYYLYKTIFRPEVSKHWVYEGNKVRFVDGTEILYYYGVLPDGYQ